MKFWLKSCSRCGGDLEAKMDISGPYIECVQCGAELAPREQCARGRAGARFPILAGLQGQDHAHRPRPR